MTEEKKNQTWADSVLQEYRLRTNLKPRQVTEFTLESGEQRDLQWTNSCLLHMTENAILSHTHTHAYARMHTHAHAHTQELKVSKYLPQFI